MIVIHNLMDILNLHLSKYSSHLFKTIAANKPVGGKTTRGAVRRQHQGMSDSEAYQDDHVPEGARPNRWQSLHFVCRYEHHHKPVYSLQRHRDVWHVGASAKNALHCKRLVWSLETAARLPASKGGILAYAVQG